MLKTFDHLIFVTHDLEAGARAFENCGFTVTHRDDAEIGATENKLVVFKDGSYVEIVRFTDPKMLPQHRFNALAESGGWAEAVIAVEELEEIHAALVAADMPTSHLRLVRKTLKSGEEWAVALSHLGRGVGSPLMPMLAEDRTPHHLRVPDQATDHANGATHIAGVDMVACDGAPAPYQVLFGTDEGTLFGFGTGREIKHLPADGQDAHLAKRGEGILAVRFATADGGEISLAADQII